MTAADDAAERNVPPGAPRRVFDGIVCLQNFPSPTPDFLIDDGVMRPIVDLLVFVVDLAEVGVIVEDSVNRRRAPWFPALGRESFGVEFRRDHLRRLDFDIPLKDSPDQPGFLGDDHQFFVFGPVAQNDDPARVQTLASAGPQLVPGPLRNYLPLVLAECHQNVQHHAPGRGRGIDFLSHGNELDTPFVKLFCQVGKIRDTTAQPVNTVDRDDIDQPGFTVGKQFLQGGPVHVAARKSAVVVMLRQTDPAVRFLTGDVTFAGFPLSVQRIEFLLKPVFNALAAIHGAALFFDRVGHYFTPKNTFPFQQVPVMARATADREV